MIPSAFDYVKASTVDEAVSALAAAGEDAKVLGGGQSLLPVLRLRLNAPTVLVDVSQVDEMRHVTDEGASLLIGAAVTTFECMHHDLVREHAPLLASTAGLVADPAIRHRGTFGGSVTHADPAGDLPTVAATLDAEMVVAGPGGRRTVAAKDFFLDFFTTAVGLDEVLVAVRIPKLGAGWGFDYQKFHRTSQAWAIVGVAAAVRVEGGDIAEARVGLTNMGATPIRAASVEAALERRTCDVRGHHRGLSLSGGRHRTHERHACCSGLPAAPRPRADGPRGREGRRPVGGREAIRSATSGARRRLVEVRARGDVAHLDEGDVVLRQVAARAAVADRRGCDARPVLPRQRHRVAAAPVVGGRHERCRAVHDASDRVRREPGEVDERDDDPVEVRASGQRGETAPQRRPHPGGPLRVVDQLGVGHVTRPGAEHDEDRIAASGAQHAHRPVDEPLTVKQVRRLRSAEPAALPCGQHETGRPGHLGAPAWIGPSAAVSA